MVLVEEIDPRADYDTKQAATILGRPVSTLERWRKDDFGPAYTQYAKRGRCTYAGADLIDFIRQGRRVSAQSEAAQECPEVVLRHL